MKLSDYLAQEGLTNAEFARRVGLSDGMISLLCRGHTWVSRDSAAKIMEATNGQVTPTDFVEAAE